MNKQFLFAWSEYIDDNSIPVGFKPVYFAVNADLSIYSNDNWNEFYKHTSCYCEHRKQIFCNGFLTSNQDKQLFEHKSYKLPFYIENNNLVPVQEDLITFYPADDDGGEAAYFRNNTHCD